MRRTIDSYVNWKVISSRDWSSERGGKSIAIEMEVDLWLELTARIWSGVESKTACCNMSGKITVDQHRGANNLRREQLEDCASTPHYV